MQGRVEIALTKVILDFETAWAIDILLPSVMLAPL